MALCDSWDCNWMDGACGFDGASNPDDDEHDVDAFQAAVQPLPAWDGVPCSNVTNENNGSSCSHEDLGAAIRRRRAREWAKNRSYFWPEDPDMVTNHPDLDVVGHGDRKPGGCTSADSSILRASKVVADPNVTLQPPQLQPWTIQHSTSPGHEQHGHVLETEGTLTHVIRLHRTGSIVVERKGSPGAPGEDTEKASFVGLGQHGGGSGYYAEEERFWQERCPTDHAATTAARGEGHADDTAQPRQISSIGARLDRPRSGEATYDYSRAEAAYRPSARASDTHRLAGPNAYNNDRTVKNHGRSRRQSARRTRFEEATGDTLHDAGEIFSQELRSPPRQAANVNRGVRADRIEKKEGDVHRRRSRSLRDTESVLDDVLESMTCAGPTENTFSVEDAGIHPRRNAESSPRSRSTQQEQRASALRQRVDDVFRDEARRPTSKGKIRHRSDDVDGTTPRQSRRVHCLRHDRGDDYDHNDRDDYPPPWSRQSPLEGSRGDSDSSRFGGGGTTVGADSQRRRGVEGAEDEGEEDVEDESAGRVAELGRRIALRCLHMEQECLRRERAQTRLFQEQLCGARQAAQDAARRIIREDRSRSKRVLTEMRKRLEEREAELVDKLEKAEESWTTESREALGAAATAAKSEVDRVRRQAKEAAEAVRRDNDKAMEKQVMHETPSLHRSSRSSLHTLRRAVEGKTRAEEKAALEAKTVQESLSAQVRSWKAKAEVAERRALEERDKRKGLEADKSILQQGMDKARQQQESVLRDLRTKAEGDRAAHATEIERLEEAHRANLLRVHEDKKKLSDAARRRWQQEMQELRAEAVAKAEDAATRAAAERAEALRRLRLAHDAEMRKAGRDILRLERELRRGQQEEPNTGALRSKTDAPLSPLPLASYSPKTLLSEVEPQTPPSPVPGSVDTVADPAKNGGGTK
ncbi:unnamed protein product [Scytosiphon promiscuus]